MSEFCWIFDWSLLQNFHLVAILIGYWEIIVELEYYWNHVCFERKQVWVKASQIKWDLDFRLLTMVFERQGHSTKPRAGKSFEDKKGDSNSDKRAVSVIKSTLCYNPLQTIHSGATTRSTSKKTISVVRGKVVMKEYSGSHSVLKKNLKQMREVCSHKAILTSLFFRLAATGTAVEESMRIIVLLSGLYSLAELTPIVTAANNL